MCLNRAVIIVIIFNWPLIIISHIKLKIETAYKAAFVILLLDEILKNKNNVSLGNFQALRILKCIVAACFRLGTYTHTSKLHAVFQSVFTTFQRPSSVFNSSVISVLFYCLLLFMIHLFAILIYQQVCTVKILVTYYFQYVSLFAYVYDLKPKSCVQTIFLVFSVLM